MKQESQFVFIFYDLKKITCLQLDPMQRSMGMGEPSPTGYKDITAPASVAQRTSWKRRWKDF